MLLLCGFLLFNFELWELLNVEHVIHNRVDGLRYFKSFFKFKCPKKIMIVCKTVEDRGK